MEQLEIRTYERQEIAEITGVKLGSHNFIRDVRSNLEKWGYTCETPRGGPVNITSRPTSAKAKLKEVMLRLFKLDTQIANKNEYRDGTLDFACFLDFMLNEPAAEMMPWATRHLQIKEMYGMEISEVTLRRWTSRLIRNDVFYQDPSRVGAAWWKTMVEGQEKIQTPVPENEIETVYQYFRRRSEIFQSKSNELDDSRVAWSETYKALWAEFGCCYYRCRCLKINGIGNDEIDTIITLVNDIIEDGV